MKTGDAHTTSSPEESVADPVRWLRFLPRWTLMVGLATLTLPIVFIGGIGQQVSDNALGPQYVELLQAIRSPGMYRLGFTLDALIWLMLGGSLLALAGLLRRHAPVRAAFIAVCGMAQLFGAFASFLRLAGIGDLALRFMTASPDQQAAMREAYLHLSHVINASNQVGVVLQGAGFILAAWGLFSLRGFPRWLALWFALPGLLGVTQFALFAAGAPVLRALNIIGVLAGNIALNFAVSAALWHPATSLEASARGVDGI